MNRKNAQRLGSILDELIKGQHLENKLNEHRLVKALPEVLGTSLSEHVSDPYIKNKVLFLRVDSSVIRHELQWMRHRLVEQLNNRTGGNTISEIILK